MVCTCILNTWNHNKFLFISHPNIYLMRKLIYRNSSLHITNIHFPPIRKLLTNTGQLAIGQVISPFEPIVKPIHQYKKVLNCTLDARFIGNLGHLINVKYCLKIYSAWHMIIFIPILPYISVQLLFHLMIRVCHMSSSRTFYYGLNPK